MTEKNKKRIADAVRFFTNAILWVKANPKKFFKYSALLYLTFVAGSCLVGLIDMGTHAQKREEQAQQQQQIAMANPLKTTPQELLQNYKNNEVATDNALKGHYIEVTGLVTDITKSIGGDADLYMETGDRMDKAQMTLEESESDKAAQLRKYSMVTIVCREMRYIMGSPMGHGCVLR